MACSRVLHLSILLLIITFPVASNSEKITIYTENLPPYSYIGKQGEILGTATELVTKLMAEAGLDYDMRVEPWVRAYRDVSTLPNTLIFSMVRTSEREKRFNWVVPLFTDQFYLIGHKKVGREITTHKIQSGKYKAICLAEDFSCTLLESLGFPKDRIIQFSSSGDFHTAYKMMMNKRIDFYVDTLIRYHFADEGIAKKMFHPQFPIKPKAEFYLAANINFPSQTQQQIAAAHKRLIEKGDFQILKPETLLPRSQLKNTQP